MSGRAATTSIIEGKCALSVGDPGTPVPEGWTRVPLLSIAELGTGHTPSRSRPEYWDGGVPWIAIPDARDNHTSVITETSETVSQLGLENSAARILPSNTVGLSRTASVGYVFIMGRPMATSQDFVTWTCSEALDPRFLMYALLAEGDDIRKFGKGSTHTTIYFPEVKAFNLTLAPKPEQRRIVAKLDSLRARSSRARQELDHIPKLIERYKQAILAQAFSGQLTADWREQHTNIGTGAEALAEIEGARNSLLEGRAPTRRGPVSDGEAGRIPVEIPDLPATWEQSSLETITSPVRLIQYGILKPGDDVPGGVPYVKVMNIQGGHVRLEKIRRTTPEIHGQYRRSAIATGDILLSIRGTVGRLAFVPPELDGGNITQDSVRIDVLPSMNARFVYWYLHSPAARDYFVKNQKGVAVRGINVGDVRPMEIPIPPEAEQVRIVTLVEHAIAWLDKIATEHARAEHLLPKLDQAILAKAFRGRLVPQDPNDEPASELLQRIKTDVRGGASGKRR